MKLNSIVALLISFVIQTSVVLAEKSSLEDFSSFPASGVVAASGHLPSGSLALPQLPMGMDGRPVPFVGSLSKSKEKGWEFSITNKTDRKLIISLEVAQYDSDRNRIASSNARFKLSSKAVGQDKVASLPKTAGCVLVVTSWSLQ